MLKILSIVILLNLLIMSSINAQNEYATSNVTVATSFNDFANVNATVNAGAGYYWFFVAVNWADWWNGSSWSNIVQNEYDSDYPYNGIWHEWSIVNQEIPVTGIAFKGDGTFRFRFSVTVNSTSDEDAATFTVNDVIAPSTPTNLSVIASDNMHPYLSWTASPQSDVEAYIVHKKIGNGSYSYLTSTASTHYEDTDETVLIGNYANETYAYYKIKAIDFTTNESNFTEPVSIKIQGDDPDKKSFVYSSENLIMRNFYLFDNYPNPFNPTTNISFSIPKESQVKLTVYSINGEKITELINGFLEKGFHTVEWNGTNQNGSPVSTGIYIYELITGDQRLAKKMFLAK